MKTFTKKVTCITSWIVCASLILCSCQQTSGSALSTDPTQKNSLANGLTHEDLCVEWQCEVPETDESGNQIYAIVSPVGYHNVDMIDQSERLDTLDGKKIALVGGSFRKENSFGQREWHLCSR